jgi:hypothetical protein
MLGMTSTRASSSIKNTMASEDIAETFLITSVSALEISNQWYRERSSAAKL